jgi:hypothetical protein
LKAHLIFENDHFRCESDIVNDSFLTLGFGFLVLIPPRDRVPFLLEDTMTKGEIDMLVNQYGLAAVRAAMKLNLSDNDMMTFLDFWKTCKDEVRREHIDLTDAEFEDYVKNSFEEKR